MNKSVEQKSPFLALKGIEYFDFEEDFVEKNIRCIPMIVRFKMDAVGIKLKLAEWNRFSEEEKIALALMPFEQDDREKYKSWLVHLIARHTGNTATLLTVSKEPGWRKSDSIPPLLQEKANEFDWAISPGQWVNLTDLQRFALLKLCRPGHQNKNFPKAMNEFKLLTENQIS